MAGRVKVLLQMSPLDGSREPNIRKALEYQAGMLLKEIFTSRAETNCKGLSAVFMSGIFDSKS